MYNCSQQMKKLFKIVVIILLSLIVNHHKSFAKTELKIGAFLPLTGENEIIGQNIYQSILITIFELKNLNIKVIPLDTKSSAEGARLAFQRGIEKNVDIFVGPVFFQTLNQISNQEKFKDKIFISYNNHENKTFPNVINFGVNLTSQISSLQKVLDKTNFVFFGDNSDFSKKVYEKIKKNHSNNHRPVFFKNFNDIDKQAKKITNFEKRNNFHLEKIKKLENIEGEENLDLIESLKKHDTSEPVNFKNTFISAFDNELIASIAFFDFYDANYKDVQFVTLNLWFDKKYLIEPSLENLIFPSIDLKGFRELDQKYKKNYGRNIYHLESLTFDIIPLIASIWFSNSDPQLKASMFNGSYKGKTGSFTIKENKTNRELFLYKIEGKKFKKI